jgi:hypothetical protein
VLVVGLGALTMTAAIAVNRVLADPDGGWFAYAPNTGVTFAPDDGWRIWRSALVWLVATLLWVGISFWLLRSRTDPSE